jgi:PAS domain S-box-containing protein
MVAVIAVVWTAFIFTSLAYHYLDSRKHIVGLAHEAASERLQKDLLYRYWAAGHGGVYVPVTPATPPNPYLSHVKERDIMTPSGKQLTLVNPAYMTRQVHELGKLRFGNRAHITSSRPINPLNTPDAWEAKALDALEKGAAEFGEVVALDSASYYRLMIPLRTEQSCLKCHAKQGYQIGDMRGGLSSAVPMRDYEAVLAQHLKGEVTHFAAAWFMGIVVMMGAVPFVKRRMDERDQALASLVESEDRYRALFEQSRDAIFMLDAEGANAGRIVSANRAALDMHGYGEKDLADLRMQDLLTPEDAKAFPERLCRLQAEGSLRFETLHRRKNGSEFLLEVTETRIAIGGRRYCMSVGRDFSELRQSEEQRRRLEEQLIQAQKIESIGRLAGGVAHDINNMLMPILGYANMLSGSLHQGDPRKEETDNIIRSAERVRDIARQLLAFARKQTLAMKLLDLNAVLSGFEKMLRRTIREDIVIETRYAPSLPLILGDAGQIEQVILNLAVNAQDAMQNGGRLTIETGRARLDQAFSDSHKDAAPGDYVAITVKDTGAGMSRDVLALIFEPFFTTKERGRGTGLGLAMVYGIVKQHGGYVDVASAPGKGSTFAVYLPATDQASHPGEGHSDLAAVRGKETVLVLEDQPEVLTVVATMLKEYGYRVLEATTPEAGLARAQDLSVPIDLLVTDVIMPGMNGTDIYRKMKLVRPSLQVLYMSGYPEDVISTHGVLRSGINFIQKPFSPAVLLNKVRLVLGRTDATA